MIKNVFLVILYAAIGVSCIKAQMDNKIIIDDDIQLIYLHDSIYIHITWHELDNFGRFPSNGLIIIKDGKAIMIDTPIDNEKTERLTNFLHDSLSVILTKLIIGHFHVDCMGGLEYIQSIGIESIANLMTIDKCKEIGLPIPSTSFKDSLVIDFSGKRIICRYFGAGHSFDNIVVWIPDNKILFGGCLIKYNDSQTLGNLLDAKVYEWDLTIKKIINEYKEINIVIPGHGDLGGSELLTHTIKLVEKEKNKQ